MLGEYDAGYENYIDSLIREIEKLQDENDKLSEQVSSLVGRSFRTADKMSCIEADNVKLRELAKRMSDRVNYECRCCSVFCSDWDEDNECCVFTTLMRELGVDE